MARRTGPLLHHPGSTLGEILVILLSLLQQAAEACQRLGPLLGRADPSRALRRSLPCIRLHFHLAFTTPAVLTRWLLEDDVDLIKPPNFINYTMVLVDLFDVLRQLSNALVFPLFLPALLLLHDVNALLQVPHIVLEYLAKPFLVHRLPLHDPLREGHVVLLGIVRGLQRLLLCLLGVFSWLVLLS